MPRRKKQDANPSSVKIIKRYGNRKLYDTEQSSYVTLEGISHMIRKGEDLQVVDNKTGEDLTSIILAQIMLEEEKSKKNALPLSVMKNLIQQSGESLTEWMQKGKESISTITMEGRAEDTAIPLISLGSMPDLSIHSLIIVQAISQYNPGSCSAHPGLFIMMGYSLNA